MCSQYMQATKPKPSQHQPSTSTITSDTQDVTDPTTEIYDPWDTIKLFKRKTETISKAVSNNDCINQVLNKLEEEIMFLADKTKQNNKDNISKAERLALRSLKENKDIVINKADKGSTVVVLNKKDYIEEGLKHLDSPYVYKQPKSDTTPFIMRFLGNVTFNKWLPHNFVTFCTPPPPPPPGRLQNIPTVLPKENSQKSNGN